MDKQTDKSVSHEEYYLDIGKKEQKRRLRAQKSNPLKQWKTSPIDEVAIERRDDYMVARNAMLERTSSPKSRWIVVSA